MSLYVVKLKSACYTEGCGCQVQTEQALNFPSLKQLQQFMSLQHMVIDPANRKHGSAGATHELIL